MLLRVHVAFLSILTLAWPVSCVMSGAMTLCCSTRSRHLGESPAMFPSAHTACSRTSSWTLASRATKTGTAPCSITTAVCWLVPLAMLVRAHAASNWSCGASSRWRNSTSRGTMPWLMTSSIGGLRSMESSFRKSVVAWSCVAGSFVRTPATISGIRAMRAAAGSAGPPGTLEVTMAPGSDAPADPPEAGSMEDASAAAPPRPAWSWRSWWRGTRRRISPRRGTSAGRSGICRRLRRGWRCVWI
mmetsp:Transcript_22453/g.55630  ORF Transcript_22453/g.55630 Transcript_22453/m.55630 type:complete len:244 (+) Transcript_22453:1089-1820(+)